MKDITRLVFRGDAVFDFSFGVLMLLAPWAGDLFDLLHIPNPAPEVFTQFCGGLLGVFAYFELGYVWEHRAGRTRSST
jgi:hypothetical protein